jgi:O-antigen/teichoic acid export membrane protein
MKICGLEMNAKKEISNNQRQSVDSGNNKRIAKNTALLYVRMLLTMFVSLYTSRVVLKVLGIENFGIYNVVGGVVMMSSFLNTAMSSATQRYLSFELGKKNYKQLKKVFSITVNIHFFIALVVVLLAETLGLWFLNSKLNIPEIRLVAANCVYQFSVATFFMAIITVPYNAAIIAHERMNIYAYFSIFEVLAKLGVVYLIQVLSGDKLVIYAGLIFLIATLDPVIYGFYCKRNFQECSYSWVWDRDKYKEILSFAGWNIWGNLAVVGFDQGINILLNIFFGPVVNAARGVAYQVNSAINSFVSSFQVALNPQIIKSYAANNVEYVQRLLFQGSRLSYYLLLLLTLPVLFQTELLLRWWLKDVPDYTVIFTQLILINALITSLSGSLITAAQATGRIRAYQSIVGGILLLNVPLSYIFLRSGSSPSSTMIITIAITFMALIARLLLLQRLGVLNSYLYVKRVLLNVLFVTVLVVGIVYTFISFISFDGLYQLVFRSTLIEFTSVLSIYDEFYRFVFRSTLIEFVSILSIYFVGLNQDERSYINSFLVNKIKLPGVGPI